MLCTLGTSRFLCIAITAQHALALSMLMLEHHIMWL